MLSVIAVIWGSSFLLIDIGLDALRPGVITMARVVLGYGALSLLPRARVRLDAQDQPRVVLLGIVWIGIPLVLFPIAQQWISSSVAGMLNGAVPLTSAAWAGVLLRTLPGGRQAIGLIVGFAGIVAVSWPGLGEGDSTLLGTVLVLLAVALYGLATNLAVPLQQKYGALPVLRRAQQSALMIVVPFGLWQLPGSHFELGPVLAMVPLGVLGTGVAFVMMTTLVGRVGAPRGAVAIYFVPIVAIGFGVAFRGDDVAPIALVGTVLVIAGAWLASRRVA